MLMGYVINRKVYKRIEYVASIFISFGIYIFLQGGGQGKNKKKNKMPSTSSSSSTSSKDPIHFFFIERYQQAYKDQLNSFIETVKTNSRPKVTFEDGRKALIIANAAYESYKNKRTVEIKYD